MEYKYWITVQIVRESGHEKSSVALFSIVHITPIKLSELIEWALSITLAGFFTW